MKWLYISLTLFTLTQSLEAMDALPIPPACDSDNLNHHYCHHAATSTVTRNCTYFTSLPIKPLNTQKLLERQHVPPQFKAERFFLCRHFDNAPINRSLITYKENPKSQQIHFLPHFILCNGKQQFLLIKNQMGYVSLLPLEPNVSASGSHSEQAPQG